jgi:dienelactone hydrolase
LLLLVGGADDWTPAAPCGQLVRQAQGRQPEIERYAGAFHGFDSHQKLHVRTDVPRGVHPGRGVTVGGNPQARRHAIARLLDFVTAAPPKPLEASVLGYTLTSQGADRRTAPLITPTIE